MNVQEVIDLSYNQYLSGGTLREARNKLVGSLDATTDQVTLLGGGNNVGPGTMLVAGLEVMSVVSTSGTTHTVIRADRGTTAQTHTDGDLVAINPKWPVPFMVQALRDELTRLSARGLFQMKTFDLRFVSSRRQYNIPISVADEWIDDYMVRWETTDSSFMWPRLNSYEVIRGMPVPGDTTDDAGTPITQTFADGFTILLHEGGISGKAFRIWYKARFDSTAIVDLTTDLAATGLPVEAHDVAALGITTRLLPSREIARNLYENQGPTRRAQEVPVGAEQRAGVGVQMLYEDRIEDERNRLNRQWPKFGNFTTQTLGSLSIGAGYGFG
jgi:hypothetical protein